MILVVWSPHTSSLATGIYYIVYSQLITFVDQTQMSFFPSLHLANVDEN